MKIPIQNVYYLLCYAWNRLDERDIVDVTGVDTTSLADLFAKVLIGGMGHLLKRGLDRGYINRSEEGRCIRGKLNFGPTIKQNLLIQAKVFCDYDELSHNVLHNKILMATIRSLVTVDSLNKDLKDQLIGLQRRLHGIDDIKLNSRLFSSVQLNRNNSFYDFLLKICELIFDNLLVTEDPGKSKFRDFLQDESKMPLLFEEFVRNFYKIEAKACKVSREDIAWHAIVDEKDQKYLPKMETDISIERDNSKTIIDTKFYKEALVTHYGQEKIRSEHLYQIHAYLTHLERKGGINRKCSGILLYPTVDKNWCIPMKIFDKYKVTVCTIKLNQDWMGIHKDLMTTLDEALTPSTN